MMFEFDPDAVRAAIEARLKESGSLAGLEIEPNKPSTPMRFAIVGLVPKAKSRARWYHCSYCETDRKFAAGYIILGEDGLLRLIGLDCWKHHLDEETFEAERGNYRQYRLRQSFLAVRPELLKEIATYFPELRSAAARSSHPIRALERLSGQIASKIRPLWVSLDRAKKAGALLDVVRPPTEAERQAAELRGQASPRSVGETIAVVRGINILEPKHASHQFDRISDMLGEFQELVEQEDCHEVSSHVLWSRFRRLRTIGQALEQIVESANTTISDGLLFLDDQNIRNILRWANHPSSDFHDWGKLSLEDRSIVFDTSGGQLSILSLPDPSLLRMLPTPSTLTRLLDRIN